MKRKFSLVVIVLVLVFSFGFGTALAHEGPEVSVKPLAPKAGSEVTVEGSDLGANSKIEVRLVGTDVDMVLGQVDGDDDGGFTTTFTLPDDLKPGTYQIQAKGTESASVQITVAAAPVAAQTTAAPEPVTTAMPAEMTTAAPNPVTTAATEMNQAGAAQTVPANPATTVATQTKTKSASQQAPMALTNEANQRPFGEALILVAVFGVLAAFGLVIARTARRAPNP